MPRAWIAGATIALLATPAFAAPGFGSSSWTVSSDNASARAEAGDTTMLASLLSFFNINIEKSVARATGDRASEQPVRKDECEQSKAAEAEKAREAKKQAPAGPEPAYLAF